MKISMLFQRRFSHLLVFSSLLFSISTEASLAQNNAQLRHSRGQGRASVSTLQSRIDHLEQIIEEMRSEEIRARTEANVENSQLKDQLRVALQKLDAIQATVEKSMEEQKKLSATAEKNPATDTKETLTRIEEDRQLLSGKLDEQYQTKIESASKYRVKIFGTILMNIFSNKGNVDYIEIPGIALPRTASLTGGETGGSFGGTLRQSELGLQVFGPSVAGAKTEGNFVADFLGDYPDTLNGFSAGTLRLRTGTIRFNWSRTSVIAGQDDLFFSPRYPTSYASLGIPALSYAGNLWAWMPQVRVEHSLIKTSDTSLIISGGILDPLTGEIPTNEFLRAPGAGESSRQPGYGGRIAWRRNAFGRSVEIGVGGYYSQENWAVKHTIHGWAATTDWTIPVGKYFDLSGAFYRGEAIGAFGAATGRTVLVNGPLTDVTTTVKPSPTVGGWTQLKFRPITRLQFNVAAGQDSTTASEVRGFTFTPLSSLGSPLLSYFPGNLVSNRSGFINIIYRPRSNLVFSAEFRRLRTFTIDNHSDKASQINLMTGILF